MERLLPWAKAGKYFSLKTHRQPCFIACLGGCSSSLAVEAEKVDRRQLGSSSYYC